jgi:hypothetical protein
MPLDQEALNLVRFSASRLTHLADDFIRRLHQDIGVLSPRLTVSMADQGWPFCVRMAQAVIWVALTDEPPGVVVDVLREVGMDNWHEGFPDAEYVNVVHALVRAIRGLVESDWITSMASAWISCFQWMQPHLLAGAKQAAAEYAFASGPPTGSPPAHRAQLASANEPPAAPAARPPNGRQVGGRSRNPLDDEDDEVGYGQIMVSMTLSSRRERQHP